MWDGKENNYSGRLNLLYIRDLWDAPTGILCAVCKDFIYKYYIWTRSYARPWPLHDKNTAQDEKCSRCLSWFWMWQFIFFLITGIMLCFGFRMVTISITQQCLVVLEQCLHRAKAFLASRAALPARRLRMHKELGRETTRTAEPTWVKGCPLLWDVMWDNKTGD